MSKKYTCRSQLGSSSCFGVSLLIYFFKDWLPQLIKLLSSNTDYGSNLKYIKKNIYIYVS